MTPAADIRWQQHLVNFDCDLSGAMNNQVCTKIPIMAKRYSSD
jgi:hypothetical protein